jgi:hypothetical protein
MNAAENYLSDIEKAEIKRFNENKVLKEAVRKVMLEPLYLHGTLAKGGGGVEDINTPSRNFVLTPVFNMLLGKREMWDAEKIGQWTLAAAQAIQMVEQGFGTLEKLSDVKAGVDKSEVTGA